MKSSGKPSEIITKLNEMAGFAADEEIELFEVCPVVDYPMYCVLFPKHGALFHNTFFLFVISSGN